jgi:hypothetical protein
MIHIRRVAQATVGLTTAVMIWCSTYVTFAAEAYTPRVGEPHADFMLPRIDNGHPIKLSDLRGKRVLLIHFASW